MYNKGRISIDLDNDTPFRHRSGFKILAAFTLLLLVSMLAIPAIAHSPSQVHLAYDDLNQTLNVTITHTSSNIDSHFIREVVVQKNGDDVLRKEYTNQTATTTFSYNYPINASSADLLRAVAYCSISGSRSAEIRVK